MEANKAIVIVITILLGVALALMGLDIDLKLVWQVIKVRILKTFAIDGQQLVGW